MYQRFYGGNVDEGWTRLILEQFGFPHTTIKDDEVKNDRLSKKYDVIIFPDDAVPLITGEKLEEFYKERFKGKQVLPKDPPEYCSGIGSKGVENLKKFVEEGGTLITFNEASQLALEKFGLRINNVLKDMKSKEFFCPGSMLKAEIDTSHRLAYGMLEKALVLLGIVPHSTSFHRNLMRIMKSLLHILSRIYLRAAGSSEKKRLRRRQL